MKISIYTITVLLGLLFTSKQISAQVVFELNATAGISQMTNPEDYFRISEFDIFNPDYKFGFSNGVFFKGLIHNNNVNFGFQAGIQKISHRLQINMEREEAYSWLKRDSHYSFRYYGIVTGGLIQFNLFSSEKLTLKPQIGININLPIYEQLHLKQTSLSYHEMKEETVRYLEGDLVGETSSLNGISIVEFVPTIGLIFGFPSIAPHFNISLEYQRYINPSIEQGAAQYNIFNLGIGYVFNPTSKLE